jgi:hypothetical protein
VVCSYILSLAALYACALVIDALAPAFRSEKGLTNALKLAVYSSTPAWIAGVLQLIPALAPFAFLLSLYGFYLFYLGLSPLMRTPEQSRVVYFIVLAIISLLIFVITGLLAGFMFPAGRMGLI